MAKDTAIADVGSGNSFHIEHYNDKGVDKYALVNSADSNRVAVFDKDEVLELTGDGKNTTLRVSATFGLQNGDPEPKIKVNTAHKTVDEDKDGVTILGSYTAVSKNKSGAQNQADPNKLNIDEIIPPRESEEPVSQKEADYALKHNVLGLAPSVLQEAIRVSRKQDSSNSNYTAPEGVAVAEVDHNNVQVPGGIPGLGGSRSLA